MIIKSSLIRKTLDNVTCVMIAFENFNKLLFESNTNSSTTTTNTTTPSSKPRNIDNDKFTHELISSPVNKKELIAELSNKSLKNATVKGQSYTKKVSLDVSNKKTSQGLNYNMLSRLEKESLINKKKENDFSNLGKKEYNDNHPSTAKNITRVKESNIIQQMRKLPSYGYFNDK